MSIELVMPSNHLIFCCPLPLLPSIFPSIRVFANKSVLCIKWPKYWSFSFSISPSNEHPGLISFRMAWLDLLAVQGKGMVNKGKGSESEVSQSYPTLCNSVDCVAHQAPLPMGFFRQEYWSGLPFPSPRDLLDPGTEPRSPTFQADALPSESRGKPMTNLDSILKRETFLCQQRSV